MIDDYYTVTSDPIEEPITLSEAKAWLRVTTTADDNLITDLIVAARQFGEKFCNRIFINTSIDCFFSALDSTNCELYPFVQVRRAPLISITDLSIYSGGSYAAFTDYTVKNSNGFSRLIFKNGISSDLDIDFPIRLQATFGYGDRSNLPDEIKTAVKAHVAFLYENRGDVAAGSNLSMPLETKLIYSRHYRILNNY